MWKDVRDSCVHNNQVLEPAQIATIVRWMYSHNGAEHSNKRNIHYCQIMDKSHIYNGEGKIKTSLINYIVYDSINMKFKNKRN